MILPYILACFSCWAQNISDLQNNVKNIPLPHSLVGITSGDSILHIAASQILDVNVDSYLKPLLHKLANVTQST